MKKQTRTPIVLALLALAGAVALGVAVVPATVQTFSQANVKLTLNGAAQKLEHEPVLLDGVTYVPLRECAENRGYQVMWDEDARQIEVDTYHRRIPDQCSTEKVDEQGVIPDEATALAVGKAILEGAMGRSVEYKDGGREFYLKAHYYENTNVWEVFQSGKYEGYRYYGTNVISPGVILDKATGEVRCIALDPIPERLTPAGRWEDGALIWPLGIQEDGTLILPENHDIPEGFIPVEDLLDIPLDYTYSRGKLIIENYDSRECIAEFDLDDPAYIFQDGPDYYINAEALKELGYFIEDKGDG